MPTVSLYNRLPACVSNCPLVIALVISKDLLKSFIKVAGLNKLPFIPEKCNALATFLKWVIGDNVVLDSCIKAFGARRSPLYNGLSNIPVFLFISDIRSIAVAISSVVNFVFKGFHVSVIISLINFCPPWLIVPSSKIYFPNPSSSTLLKYLEEVRKLFILLEVSSNCILGSLISPSKARISFGTCCLVLNISPSTDFKRSRTPPKLFIFPDSNIAVISASIASRWGPLKGTNLLFSFEPITFPYSPGFFSAINILAFSIMSLPLSVL